MYYNNSCNNLKLLYPLLQPRLPIHLLQSCLCWLAPPLHPLLHILPSNQRLQLLTKRRTRHPIPNNISKFLPHQKKEDLARGPAAAFATLGPGVITVTFAHTAISTRTALVWMSVAIWYLGLPCWLRGECWHAIPPWHVVTNNFPFDFDFCSDSRYLQSFRECPTNRPLS